MVKAQMSEEEFERQYKIARRLGNKRLKSLQRARLAHYDPESKRVIIEFLNHSIFTFPIELAQGLSQASEEDRADIRLLSHGLALDWPRLDIQLSIEGLLSGQFGTKEWMAELDRTRLLQPSSAA